MYVDFFAFALFGYILNQYLDYVCIWKRCLICGLVQIPHDLSDMSDKKFMIDCLLK